jgi:hypothetical protein
MHSAHVGQLTYHTAGQSQPFAPIIRNISPMDRHQHLGEGAVRLFINPSYAKSGRSVAAFCESIPCLPAENSQTLGPKTKIVSLCQGWRPLSPGFPRRLRSGGSRHCQ